MTGIPVSTVVSVDIAIGAAFPQRAGFGTLLLATKESGVIGIAERVRTYNNITGVAGDWGASPEVVKAATAYFSQQPKPTELKVGMRFETDQAGQLRGGSVNDDAATLAAMLAASPAQFIISIDGDSQNITGIDFTGDTSMADIAVDIEASLQAIATGGFTASTCVYENGRFFINSGTTGPTSLVSFASDVVEAGASEIATLLQMKQGEGTKADGIAGETITASLTAIEEADQEWYGLAFTKEVRDSVVINTEASVVAAAAWCEARVKVFANTTNDLDVLDSVTTSDIASVLMAASYRRTMTTFSSLQSQYPSISIIARAFVVNFAQPNSTLTLKFKQMPGISVEDLSQNQKSVLDSKRANALILVGASTMFAESYMAADGVFFDEVHGLDWLTDAVQTNAFGYLLTRTTKVPYTDKGVAALEQQVINALDEAVRNGFIAPGETIEGEFLANGYKTITVPAADMNQSDKEARFYPGLSFVILGAGALHRLQINGTFER